jgi:hypothetical protein
MRHWRIALAVGWTGIAVLLALAALCGLVIGLAIAGNASP